jgi:hypothetical protein
MDSNYIYTVISREDEQYQNADGEFFKGLFGKIGGGNDGGSSVDTSGQDGKEYLEKGLALIGVVSGFLANRKERKLQEERDRIYTPPPPPPQTNNTALYAIGGLAVVGIGVAIYLATKK